MISRRVIVNGISLLRIPLGLAFVLTFQPNRNLFTVAVVSCGLAAASDVLDGHFARRYGIASVLGRHWDSLGDKAFYASVIVGFLTNSLLSPAPGWALLFREIALYITRILYISRLPEVEKIRKFTNWHGYLMYIVILLGLIEMWSRIQGAPFGFYPFIQIAAASALIPGIASIFSFINLQEDELTRGSKKERGSLDDGGDN
jgi:phosphatidylglycerophosphate synthase